MTVVIDIIKNKVISIKKSLIVKNTKIIFKRQIDIPHLNSLQKFVQKTKTKLVSWKTMFNTLDFVPELRNKAHTVCFLKRMNQLTFMK